MTITASLSPVVKYHGLARRELLPCRFLMRPLLNAGTLGGRERMGKMAPAEAATPSESPPSSDALADDDEE